MTGEFNATFSYIVSSRLIWALPGPVSNEKQKTKGSYCPICPHTIPFWSKTTHPYTVKILLAHISLYNLREARDYMPSNSHMHLGHSIETRNCVPTHLLTSTATTYHQFMLMKPEKPTCSLTPPNPHTLQTPSMKSKTCPLASTDLCSIYKFP